MLMCPLWVCGEAVSFEALPPGLLLRATGYLMAL